MNRFDDYRWQEHAVRPGWWKLDVVLAAVSVSIIAATFDPDASIDQAHAAPPSAQCEAQARSGHPAFDASNADPACASPERRPERIQSPDRRGERWAGPAS